MATAATRDRTILKAIAALLRSSGAFDTVLTVPLAEQLDGTGADKRRLACVYLAGWKEARQFDGGETPTERTVRFFLVIAVRNKDPDARDDELDRLQNLASNLINLQQLGGEIVPQETVIDQAIYQEPNGVERRVKCVGSWVQLLDNLTDHNIEK